MKYYLPYWEDTLDPDFDFLADKFSEGHIELGAKEYDKYIHEIISQPIYDGILVSLSLLLDKLNFLDDNDEFRIQGYSNLKEYLRFQNANSELVLFGDCGAFSYVNEDVPPEKYNIEKVAQLYDRLGFDYGVSVDHLVVNSIKRFVDGQWKKEYLTPYQMKKRMKITRDNADKFIKIVKENKYKFTPVGSAQGYSPRTYRNSVAELIEMGYEYIGLGGLARSTTKEIIEILKAVKPVLKDNIRLHLFGIQRPNHFEIFREYNVYSFDSASFFRKAWLRSGQNYLSSDCQKWYTAIRVPQVETVRMKKSLEEVGVDFEFAKALEQECLKYLRDYDKGLISYEKIINTLHKYDSLLKRNGDDGTNLLDKYIETLKDMPWKKCGCELCEALGIDIIIFRGSNRNKRRGFHNTYVFYNYLTNYNQRNKVSVK